MKKILFFDIDGTLSYHGQVPKDNLEALQQLKDHGYLTFICTGRAVHYAKRLFGNLVSGYVGCNGRYIEYNNQKLHGEAFSDEELEYYINTCVNNNIGYMFVGDDKSYYGNCDEYIINALIKDYGEDKVDLYKPGLSLYTLDMFFGDPSRFTEVEALFKDTLVMNNHHQGSCDCTTLSFDKGSAIAYLLKYFNIDKQNSYAFGDGSNDVFMFREVSNRIAMGNAIDSLKQQATYITDDYDKQGITKALKHLDLI